NISLVAGGATQTVPVTYNVPSGAGTGGNVQSDKGALSFTTQVGSNPASQTISITNVIGSSPIPFTVQVNSTGWLSVSPSSGSTPLTLTVNVNAAGLAQGAYSGSVVITPTGGSANQITVSLTVSPATAVSATPA